MPLGAGVAHQGVADDEAVTAEVTGDARAMRDREVFQHRASHFLAEGVRIREADRLVGGLVRRGELLLALHLQAAVRILRDGESADHGALAVVLLAMRRKAGAHERRVVRGDLDPLAGGIRTQVDVALLVVDVIVIGVQFACPAGGFQQLPVDEHQIVVETVQRRAHALAFAPPPAERRGGEQGFPLGAPHAVAQRFPFACHARALQYRPLAAVGLDGDALAELQAAGSVHAAAQDDGVAGDDTARSPLRS